jgi:hypothetical protein
MGACLDWIGKISRVFSKCFSYRTAPGFRLRIICQLRAFGLAVSSNGGYYIIGFYEYVSPSGHTGAF